MPHFPNYRLGTPYPTCDSSLTLLTSVFEADSYWPELKTFNVFPNPAQSIVTLQYEPGVFQQATFHLFDVLGREVLQQKLEGYNGAHTFEVGGLAEGVYFYQINSKEVLIGSGKLVKQAP